MKKRMLLFFVLTVCFIAFGVSVSYAETEGDLTYVIQYGEAWVTGCNTSAEGEIIIPEALGGCPVTSINGSAFSNCANITKVIIPESVTRIGQYAFMNCTGLKEIDIPDKVTIIEDYLFFGCSSLEKVYIPDNVKTIEYSAFKDCSSLKEIEIPKTVTEIGYSAFEGCSSLTEIEIPDGVETIYFYMFKDCSSLKKITLPKTLKGEIGSQAFENCSSLEEITICEGVTSLDYGVFKYCSSIKKIVLPKDLKKIAGSCFEECVALEEIVLPDDIRVIPYRAFYNCDGLTTITIPKNTVAIEYNVFYGCNALKKINFNNNLKKIDGNSFAYCTSLEEITLPESLEQIAFSAFENCTKLGKINIGKNIRNIGTNAFGSTVFSEDESNWENGVLYLENYLIKADKNAENCVVKDGTILIGAQAFYGNKKLKEMKLPESVKFICDEAFVNTRIKSFSFPDSVEEVGCSVVSSSSYYNDSANWDGYLLYIGKHLVDADRENSKGEIVIKEGTRTIGGGVFSDGSYAYDRITSVVIPDSVIFIGDTAFNRLRNVEEFNLPEGLLYIGESAFGECSKLKEIVIPKSVRRIRSGAFFYENLEKIYVLNPLCKLEDGVISYATIYGYDCSEAHKYALKNENDFVAFDSEITAVIKREDKTIICNNINVSEPSKGGEVIVALCYRYGAVYDVEKSSSLTNGNVVFELSEDIHPDDLCLKFFWWDNTSGRISPLSESKITVAEQY